MSSQDGKPSMDRYNSSSFPGAPPLPPLSSVRRLSPLGPAIDRLSTSPHEPRDSAKRRRLSHGADRGPELERVGEDRASQRQRFDRSPAVTWSVPPPTCASESSAAGIVEQAKGNPRSSLKEGTSLPILADQAVSGGSSAGMTGLNAGSASPFVRRKRAIAACEFCRTRKTKCDNVRPVCGSCRRHQARCVYADGSETDGMQFGLDQAADRHREVIQRLDDIRSLLASSPRTLVDEADKMRSGLGLLPHLDRSEHLGDDSDGADEETFSRPSQPLPPSRSTDPAAYLQYTKCEATLKWPVLQAVITPEDAAIDSFIFDAYVDGDNERVETPATAMSVTDSTSPRPGSRGGVNKQPKVTPVFGQGVRDQAFVTLCQKFLALVNCRNPIMDANDLILYARSVAEDGLEWDSKSCLVLLACALASYSRAWTPPPFVTNSPATPPVIVMPRRNSTVAPDVMSTSNNEAAEAYYEAAQKRLGGLGTSLIDIQCFYFASLYEKFAFRPVKAWMHLQQAASRLRIHHMVKPREGKDLYMGGPEEEDDDARASNISYHFEQRAFWSIHKAEREFATELGITLASDLASFHYPVAFPTPPETLNHLISTDDDEDVEMSDVFSPRRNEFVWFFYLAQISLRRSLDEVLAVVYENGEENWITNIDLVYRQYHESKKQIADWQSHLPPAMRYDPTSQPNNEMGYYLEGRFEEWNESILRPLVYYCLHQPVGETPKPAIAALAQQYMLLCVDCIRRCSSHDRHGGTWFVLRRAFRCTLVILAAVIVNGPLRPPDNWREMSRMTISTLARWYEGVQDLQRMKRVLERAYRTVCEAVDKRLSA